MTMAVRNLMSGTFFVVCVYPHLEILDLMPACKVECDLATAFANCLIQDSHCDPKIRKTSSEEHSHKY